jgi:hypothetical protein
MARGNKQEKSEVPDRNMSWQEPEPKLRKRKGGLVFGKRDSGVTPPTALWNDRARC